MSESSKNFDKSPNFSLSVNIFLANPASILIRVADAFIYYINKPTFNLNKNQNKENKDIKSPNKKMNKCSIKTSKINHRLRFVRIETKYSFSF